LSSDEDWQIRPARPGDAVGLSRVQTETWQWAYRGVFPSEFLTGLIVPVSRWEDRLMGGVTTHVVTKKAEVVGYSSIAPADDPGWGEVRAIYVHPDHQGRGYGSALLSAGLTSLAALGFRWALLWVIDRNLQGRSFYESRGWTLGRPIRIEDIGGTQVTLVRYERDLPTVS
jgi:GNAT superfamily N-acetyltransferase